MPLDRGVLFQRNVARLPAPAAEAVRAIHAAAKKRNCAALRKRMLEDFTFSFGDEESADLAIRRWRGDRGASLRQLVEVLENGCNSRASSRAIDGSRAREPPSLGRLAVGARRLPADPR